MIDEAFVAEQLKNRWDYPYQWLRKQNDHWDAMTNFIYKTPVWQELIELIKLSVDAYEVDKRELFYYAANRWYNFWSAMLVERLFCQSEFVVPALNHKNRLVDFSLYGIDFDHKTSIFPKKYKSTLYYAQKHKADLIYWLYQNQSQQQRKHLANRLFIVVHNQDGEHWKLKADLPKLKKAVFKYLSTFSKENLVLVDLENHKAWSDIIWVTE